MSFLDDLFGSSSSSTQTRTIPPPSADEQAMYSDILHQYLPAYMNSIGYNVVENKAPDTFQYAHQTMLPGNMGSMGNALPGPIIWNSDPKDATDSRTIPGAVTTSLEKSYGAAADQAAAKYGRTSPQYQAEVDKSNAQSVISDEQQKQIEADYKSNTLKFMQGDFTLNDQQKASMQDLFAPETAAIKEIFGSPGDLGQNIDQFNSQAQKAGMSLGDFTHTVGSALTSGTAGTLNQAVDNSLSINRQLLKMGIQDNTGQMITKINQQAAAMGRDPTDPDFQNQIVANSNRMIQEGELSLASQGAQSRLQIAQQAAQAKLGLANQMTQFRQALPGEQMKAGAASIGLEQALKNQQAANIEGGVGIQQNLASMLGNIRNGQGTTVSNVTNTPSTLSDIAQMAQIGASIYTGLPTGGATPGPMVSGPATAGPPPAAPNLYA